MKILVVYYSMYGHIHRMAQAVAEGVASIDGTQADLRRVPVLRLASDARAAGEALSPLTEDDPTEKVLK
jgi:multimeric flavodoxin WrbA